MRYSSKRLTTIFLSMLFLAAMMCQGAFSAAAEETTKLVWDMEDKAVIDQLITADAQKANFMKSTQYKRSGTSSLLFVNASNNGLMGNITPFVDMDMTGYEAIRFYIYNPGSTEVVLRYQFAGGVANGTPYYLDVAVQPGTDFVAVDFDLDKFEVLPYIGEGKFVDIAEAYEWIVMDSALIFAGEEPNPSAKVYIDDVMLVKGRGSDSQPTDPPVSNPTKPSADNTTTVPTDSTETTSAPDVSSSVNSSTESTAAPHSDPVSTSKQTTPTNGNAVEKPSGGFPIWAIVLIIVLAAGVIGTGGFFLWKKLKNPTR